MNRFSMKTVYLLSAFIVAAFCAVWLASPKWSRTGEGMVALQGNLPPVLQDAELVGHDDSSEPLDIVLGLKIRNEAELDDLIARQSDPQSTDFHKFISPDEFVERFAPTLEDVQKLVEYLSTNGMTLVEVSPNRLLVHVRGSVQQIEKTFNVRINRYEMGPKVEYSNDGNPSVPAEFKDLVQSVMGMDSFAVYHKHHVRRPVAQGAAAKAPNGMGPRELSTAYNYPNVHNKRGGQVLSGSGVHIAIATVYSYNMSDIEGYWRYYGVQRTGKVRNIHIGPASTQADDETTLDLQQVSSLAPGADVDMYLGSDPSNTTFAKIFNRIVNDNQAAVVSISWGLCETDTGLASMYTEHTIFRQGTAQGITFFAAAGDDGAYDCKRKKGKQFYSVDYPSSDPFVTAVGGTALAVHADGTRAAEHAWTGGGGGSSAFYRRPVWQFGPGVPTTDRRHSSDLAVNADPWTGDTTLFEGEWDTSGGTSFGTPDLGALWGLIVEGNGGARLGYAMPTLYRLGRTADYGKTFFDVTVGNNGNGQGPGYNAGPNWDHPTGWGAPDGAALMRWLVDDQLKSKNPVGTPPSLITPLSGNRNWEPPSMIFTSPLLPARRWLTPTDKPTERHGGLSNLGHSWTKPMR